MKAIRFTPAAILLLVGNMPAFANGQEATSYILVDISKVRNGEVKGLATDGYLTIARYDPAIKDLIPLAHEWKSGKNNQRSVRAIAVRSPIQKAGSTRQFLLAIEPGSWVIESSNGTVFSLGSWAFEVKAGQIVDLGVFQPTITWQDGAKRGLFSGATIDPSTGDSKRSSHPLHLEWHQRGQSDIPLPEKAKTLQAVQADYTPVKFKNYLPYILNINGFANCIDKAAPILCDIE